MLGLNSFAAIIHGGLVTGLWRMDVSGTNQAMGWDIVGHEWAVSLLCKHLGTGKVRHAYLITGDDGVGKRTLAMRFAQALNCNEPSDPGVPCGSCAVCSQIEESRFPDFHVIVPESGTKTLKVDQVRELKRQLALSPFQSSWRIALISDFELATENAANAMLKTLEEPGEYVVVLLTALDETSLLPTIVSRCEHLPLRSVARGPILDALRQLDLDEDRAELIASVSQGRPGLALRYAVDPELLDQRAERLDQLTLLLKQSRKERFELIDRLLPKRDDLETQRSNVLMALHEWVGIWRDALQIGYDSDIPPANIDRREYVSMLGQQLAAHQISSALLALQRAQHAVERYANIRLAMEVLMLDLPRLN